MCNMPGACRASGCCESCSDGAGHSGANRDYVINTAAHLKVLGLHDPLLDWLAAELQT